MSAAIVKSISCHTSSEIGRSISRCRFPGRTRHFPTGRSTGRTPMGSLWRSRFTVYLLFERTADVKGSQTRVGRTRSDLPSKTYSIAIGSTSIGLNVNPLEYRAVTSSAIGYGVRIGDFHFTARHVRSAIGVETLQKTLQAGNESFGTHHPFNSIDRLTVFK